MTDVNDSHSSTSTSSGKENSGKKSTKLTSTQQTNIESVYETRIRELQNQVDSFSSQAVVYPEAFMKFDTFCLSMAVTKEESKLLLKSLRTDPEFYEVSGKTRRLYGRTGIAHLFKIRDEVSSLIKKESEKRVRRKPEKKRKQVSR